MKQFDEISKRLRDAANPDKAGGLARFFKCGPGEYGEGDIFIGVNVPFIRSIAKEYYKMLQLDEVSQLLLSEIHEFRLSGLIILTYKAKKANNLELETLAQFYLSNLDRINNWDLVDLSAHEVLGPWLFNRERDILFELAGSSNIWSQRIAVLTTYHFIKRGDYSTTLSLAKLLIPQKHDLIQKAVGWMLREIGNRDLLTELNFLNIHYKFMPRTMLRYAIEKFEPELRLGYLKGSI